MRAGMHSGPVGRYGIRHSNVAGKQVLNHFQTHGLFAVSTFYKPKKGQDGATWTHPRSRKSYQLDHWIMSHKHRGKFCINCGIARRSMMQDSDHKALFLTMRIHSRRWRKRAPPKKRINWKNWWSRKLPKSLRPRSRRSLGSRIWANSIFWMHRRLLGV